MFATSTTANVESTPGIQPTTRARSGKSGKNRRLSVPHRVVATARDVGVVRSVPRVQALADLDRVGERLDVADDLAGRPRVSR